MRGLRRRTIARWLLWMLAIVVVAVAALVWAACCMRERVHTKESLPHADESPGSAGELGPPELQVEEHTCGFHSLSVVYRAHGLDPEAEQLRARLGVDVPANPKDPSTTGTLHPDLLRVLRQDHFASRFLDPDDDATLAFLRQHTTTGRTVLLLIQRAESGGLHWVAASRSASVENLRVFDSLAVVPYDVDTREYLRERVLSIVTIEPDEQANFDDKQAIYLDGLAEMWRVKRRLDARSAAARR